MIEEQIHRDIGELKGDVKGLVTAFARLAGQIDDHLVNDERAHARQDSRIAELYGRLAEIDGRHQSGQHWTMVGGMIAAAIIGAIAAALTHLGAHL